MRRISHRKLTIKVWKTYFISVTRPVRQKVCLPAELSHGLSASAAVGENEGQFSRSSPPDSTTPHTLI
jgi:hypothetical protein